MDEAARKRVHVFVTGLVQGVWFRANTRNQAEALALAGWVRNLPDGRVEFVAEGIGDRVDRLVEWARRGPPDARVDRLEVTEEVPTNERGGFEIRR